MVLVLKMWSFMESCLKQSHMLTPVFVFFGILCLGVFIGGEVFGMESENDICRSL